MDDTVFINEAVGKPPEVYNDADNSDESIIDVGEEADMGGGKDWMAAASPTPRTPNAASIGEVFAMTPMAAGHEEPMQDFVGEGGTAAVEQEHSEESFGSFSGESSSGADTGALHRYGVYDLAGGEAAAATGTNEYASSRGSGGDAATPGVFRSARSILTWKEDDEQEEGDAEREAEEVQALVAEALALVQEANADD
ncbi:hypothetical protein Esi_0241_0016 [Ectocarpus siliculosus]|uniref:Uncharacterized protein n=1 Tax=Ectocarpus siliculosus TaxID=2880 RepID=D7FSW9_ECTSI|nr:hypothetical protein Esi_0241_0016 [Ectocarpus siliculosus]|eukprot:CBJ31260.1 hypothetical protein Esi_0241_0016 [Ectocarpus siliculosus]